MPAYAFVPGQQPHPYADRAGHHYDPGLPTPDALLQERSPHYLLGLDLFNGGYPWEAHEVWEQLWRAAGRRGESADFLKALIKLAAAAVKQREGKPAGVRSHAGRAALLLRPLHGVRERMWGLELGRLLAAAEAIARAGWPREELYLERNHE